MEQTRLVSLRWRWLWATADCVVLNCQGHESSPDIRAGIYFTALTRSVPDHIFSFPTEDEMLKQSHLLYVVLQTSFGLDD